MPASRRRLVEKARVQQMHGGVFNAARVCVNGHPVIVLGRVERTLVIFRRQIAQVIPRRAHERIHRVGFARGRSAADGAGRMLPGRVQFQRAFTSRTPLHILGQYHGQLVIGHRIPTMHLTIDHRDRRAPISLTADQPIAIAVVHRFLANAFFCSQSNTAAMLGILSSLFCVDLRPVQHA